MMFVLKCSCLKLMFPQIWSSYVELEHLNQVEVVYISAFNRYTVKIVITRTKIGLAVLNYCSAIMQGLRNSFENFSHVSSKCSRFLSILTTVYQPTFSSVFRLTIIDVIQSPANFIITKALEMNKFIIFQYKPIIMTLQCQDLTPSSKRVLTTKNRLV